LKNKKRFQTDIGAKIVSSWANDPPSPKNTATYPLKT